jgi:hypothetical protein
LTNEGKKSIIEVPLFINYYDMVELYDPGTGSKAPQQKKVESKQVA